MENTVKQIFAEIFASINVKSHVLNERYIHHYFTRILQKEIPIDFRNLFLGLHPEWPTYKKSTNLEYAKYRKNKNKNIYEQDEDGSAGFIDFCIGEYNKPEIAIEFLHKYGWSSEDVIFDYMKLLDKRNPFKISFSLVIISREKSLSTENHAIILQNRIDSCLKISRDRLGLNFDNTKRYFFYVIEHSNKNTNRKWYIDNTMEKCERQT